MKQFIVDRISDISTFGKGFRNGIRYTVYSNPFEDQKLTDFAVDFTCGLSAIGLFVLMYEIAKTIGNLIRLPFKLIRK